MKPQKGAKVTKNEIGLFTKPSRLKNSEKVGKHALSSFPRKRESIKIKQFWANVGARALSSIKYPASSIAQLRSRRDLRPYFAILELSVYQEA